MTDIPPLYDAPTKPRGYALHQPPRMQQIQQFAADTLAYHHNEALYVHGEYTMIILLWTVRDFQQGLVERCPTCFTNFGDITEAYGQAIEEECLDCLGTTFEGGYRAKIVRPSLWNATDDRDEDEGRRGTEVMATAIVQTTADITLRKGDFLCKAGGSRWRVQEHESPVAATGFGDKNDTDTIVGTQASRVNRQDESSVIYQVPPLAEDLAILDIPMAGPVDWSVLEVIRGPLR